MKRTLLDNLKNKEVLVEPALVVPTSDVKDSYINAIKEFQEEKRYTLLNLEDLDQDFERYVETLKIKALHPEESMVPVSIFWLTIGDKYIGKTSIRHYLNDRLLREGGHVGYDIRPSERRKGYGTKILQLALIKAKQLGIEKALITCDSTNIGSRKVIESQGGILESEIPSLKPGKQSTLRFWIQLD